MINTYKHDQTYVEYFLLKAHAHKGQLFVEWLIAPAPCLISY